MAYRNTIISLVSVVALGTACSKAPNYSAGVQSGDNADQQAAVNTDPNAPIDHGADPTTPTDSTASNETKKPETPAPAPTNTPPPATTPAAAQTPADIAKAANARGYIAYAVSSPNGQGWNTAATPYLIAPSVNAAGAVDNAKPFNVIFCNFTAGAMRIHSGGNQSPMDHGPTFNGVGLQGNADLAAAQKALDEAAKTMTAAQLIAKFNPNNATAAPNIPCVQHLVNNAAANNTGSTYNHQGGNPGVQASYIYFKVYTVDPAGVVAAK